MLRQNVLISAVAFQQVFSLKTRRQKRKQDWIFKWSMINYNSAACCCFFNKFVLWNRVEKNEFRFQLFFEWCKWLTRLNFSAIYFFQLSEQMTFQFKHCFSPWGKEEKSRMFLTKKINKFFGSFQQHFIFCLPSKICIHLDVITFAYPFSTMGIFFFNKDDLYAKNFFPKTLQESTFIHFITCVNINKTSIICFKLLPLYLDFNTHPKGRKNKQFFSQKHFFESYFILELPTSIEEKDFSNLTWSLFV